MKFNLTDWHGLRFKPSFEHIQTVKKYVKYIFNTWIIGWMVNVYTLCRELRLNLNNNTLEVINLVLMFSGKGLQRSFLMNGGLRLSSTFLQYWFVHIYTWMWFLAMSYLVPRYHGISCNISTLLWSSQNTAKLKKFGYIDLSIVPERFSTIFFI